MCFKMLALGLSVGYILYPGCLATHSSQLLKSMRKDEGAASLKVSLLCYCNSFCGRYVFSDQMDYLSLFNHKLDITSQWDVLHKG